MLTRYANAVEAIPEDTLAQVLKALGLPIYPRQALEVLMAGGMAQADVVLALLRLDTPDARAAAEALLGKPVTRCPPGLEVYEPRGLYASAQWVLGLLGPENRGADARRVIWVAPNPRLPTTPSWYRFRLLHVGITVGQFLIRGGQRRDVRGWSNEGSLRLS